MRSSDTLLNYLIRFSDAQNRLTKKKITQLETLKIYHEVVKAK